MSSFYLSFTQTILILESSSPRDYPKIYGFLFLCNYDIINFMKKEVLFKDIKLAYVNLSRAIKNATETSLKYEIMISEKEYSEGKSKQIKDVDNYLNTLINARN